MTVGKPSAGFGERLAEVAHHEVDGAAAGIADEAAEGVAPAVEGEAGVMVVVERAEALVASDAEAKTLGYGFYGERAATLYFIFVHRCLIFEILLILVGEVYHRPDNYCCAVGHRTYYICYLPVRYSWVLV